MKQSTQIVVLFIVCICAFFVQLDAAFPDLMEMRNFITAREMISEGNWWFTTLNLEPRLEKPPFPTWLTAWSVMLLGDFDNLYALRLPSAIMGTLMVFFFYGFLKELSEEKYIPFIGSLVMATSVLVIQSGRTNSWDIYTHAFLVGSLWQFLLGIKRKKHVAIFFSMVLMGLSIFSKGPVSLYALWIPFVIALSFGFKEELKKHWGKLLFILLGGLIIGFAWNFYMYLFQQEATEYVLNKETNSWVNRHVKSPIFYLNFPIFIGIWIPFLVPFFFYKYAHQKTETIRHYRFTLVWLIAVILLLSLVPTKKERYVLPALIPMSMAVAYIINGLFTNFVKRKHLKYDQLLLKIAFYLISVAGLLGPIALIILFQDSITIASIIGCVLIFLVSVYGWYLYLNKRYINLFAMPIAIVCFICMFISSNIAQWSYQNDEFKSLAKIRENEELIQLDFYVESILTDPKMCWLIGKPIKYYDDIHFDKPDQFPMAVVTVNKFDYLYRNEDLSNIEYDYLGEYDFFRKKSKWKASVYQVKWKNDTNDLLD